MTLSEDLFAAARIACVVSGSFITGGIPGSSKTTVPSANAIKLSKKVKIIEKSP